MKTIKLYCKACGVPLTGELKEVSPQDLRVGDEENLVDKGQFSPIVHSNFEHLAISKYEDDNLKDHTDTYRFLGCCGSSGSGGYNKLCINGHEVGTEISDCWTPHYIAIDVERVTVKQIEDKK